MIGRRTIPLVTLALGFAIAGCAGASSSSGPAMTIVELDGRKLKLPIPAGLTHGPELARVYQDGAAILGSEVLAIFWPDSALAARREGRLREEPITPSAMVAAFRGDQWRTPQDGLAYIVLVERNRQRSMLSSSTDSTLLAQVQHVLGEDPEGQADLPIRLAPDARVCLDILSVRGRATIELQMLGPSSRAATQQGAMFTLRGHAQVVLRDDVIGMFLYRYGRPSTRAAAELKREMVAWAEQTLVANGAVAARPRPASEADPSVPKFGDFVYVEELPDPVTRVPPEYPDEARMLDISGTVTVNALVGRDGKVKETRVTQSIGLLDAAAEAAVRQWKFKPAKNKGAPVAVWVSVPVTFTLK